MIEPQHAVNIVLKEAARSGRADETMVLVTEKVEATLRWAGNSMTTNGCFPQPKRHRDFDRPTGR